MEAIPKLTDYVTLIIQLFRQFEQDRQAKGKGKQGASFTYAEEMFIIFFLLMQFRRIYQFKAQHRWLSRHPEMLERLGWAQVPHRTTISRRYKDLYETVQDFVLFISAYASELEACFSREHLVEDKSLFKALGPVWHQSDRQEGRIPEKLRHLDTDATWSKSGYHGWVFGYGLHITCNDAAFPCLLQVETASISETEVIDQKAPILLAQIQPATLSGDNAYAKASRIRHWAKQGVALLSPAYNWVNGRFAKAYHRFIKAPLNALRLRNRKTIIEPLFDLIAKVIGTTGKQKQLPVQRLANVRSCLALATLSVQIAMLANNIWGLPPRTVTEMAAAFQ